MTIGYRADELAIPIEGTPIKQSAAFVFGVIYNKPYRQKSKPIETQSLDQLTRRRHYILNHARNRHLANGDLKWRFKNTKIS